MTLPTTCDRCGVELNAHVVSYFNTQTICLDCRTEERAHPKFQEALDVETAAVLRGDYNFPGIGAPADLLTQARERADRRTE